MSTAGITEPDVARKSAGGKKPDGPYVHPSPEAMGRPIQPGDPDVPGAVTLLRKTAATAGWKVDTLYARGFAYPAPGRVGKLTHSYAVKMDRANCRVTAIWIAPAVDGALSWKFSYAGVLGVWMLRQIEAEPVTPKAFPFTLSSLELKALIKLAPIGRWIISDLQFETIAPEGREARFIRESDFRGMLTKKGS